MYTTTQPIQKSSQKIQTLNRIRANMAGLMVYNAGDEPATLIHGGMYYTFPPDGLWMGPSDEAPINHDGITEIKDVYGTSKITLSNAKAARKRGNNIVLSQLPKDEIIATAVDIAERAERKLGARGVVVLTGDPRQDESLKKGAKEAWIKYRIGRAEQTIKNYRERTKSFYSDPRNAGHLPPAMTDFETNEQMFMDEYRSGLIGGRKYVCKYKCGFQHDDQAVMVRHIKASHPAAPEDARTDALMSGDAQSEAQPARRGRRKKAEAAAA